MIRKLLDAQKIKQLTDYLQELHKRGLAKEDHTTLLINCYTNINKVDTLSKFIQVSHASPIANRCDHWMYLEPVQREIKQFPPDEIVGAEEEMNFHSGVDNVSEPGPAVRR